MRSTNRFARIVAVAGFVFLPKVGFAADETITALGDFSFLNADVTIDAGDTVTWIDLQPLHNVSQSSSSGSNVYDGSGFRSGNVGDFDTYQFTFNTPGVFYYICDPHASIGMKGSVTVQTPLDPDDVYVDFGAGTNGNGAQSLPFDNLQDAVTAANVSAVINLEPGTSAESFTGAGRYRKPLRSVTTRPGAVLSLLALPPRGVQVSSQGAAYPKRPAINRNERHSDVRTRGSLLRGNTSGRRPSMP